MTPDLFLEPGLEERFIILVMTHISSVRVFVAI